MVLDEFERLFGTTPVHAVSVDGDAVVEEHGVKGDVGLHEEVVHRRRHDRARAPFER